MKKSQNFLEKIKNIEPIKACDGQIWRLSVAPRDGIDVIESLQSAGLPIQGYFYDWAGGLIWLAIATAPHAYAKIIRAIVDQAGAWHADPRKCRDARQHRCISSSAKSFGSTNVKN